MTINHFPFRLKSASARIAPVLQSPGLNATIESAFAEACNLVAGEGSRFSLVSGRVGNGPLNAVVDNERLLALLESGQQVRGDGRRLWLGSGWQLGLNQAEVWNPIPDYQHLAGTSDVVKRNLAWLRQTLPLEAPPASLAAVGIRTQGAFGSRPSLALIESQATHSTDGVQRAYNKGSLHWLMFYARKLAGLGPGLTPAGDDWLAGWLIGLRAREAATNQRSILPINAVGAAVVRAAKGRTSDFSLAFLQAAADGAASEAWHQLIKALPSPDPGMLRQATADILRHGATSGADMVAGFLAALEQLEPND